MVELRDHLNAPNNVLVELNEVLRRDPVLSMAGRPNCLNCVPFQKGRMDVEARHIAHIARCRVLSVPIPRNLHCIFFVQHRIEDGLKG